MTKITGYLVLAGFSMLVLVVALLKTPFLSDDNLFLKGFVNHELLALIGVIVSIAVASASNVGIELKRLEQQFEYENGFESTIKELGLSAKSLIVILFFQFMIVIFKGQNGISIEWQAALNAVAIIMIFAQGLIMFSVIDLSFKVASFRIKRAPDQGDVP